MLAQPRVEGEASLEGPPPCRHLGESRHEALERGLAADGHDRDTEPSGVVEEAGVDGGAKGGGASVRHGGVRPP